MSPAFLLALTTSLGQGPGAPKPEAVDRAIDRGVEWLLSMQRLDGSWGCADPWLYPDGGTALALYALLKCGVPKEHFAVRRALAFLERFPPPTRVYSAACALLALGEHDPSAHRERIEALARFLAENGMSSLWAYPDGVADLSNTQYAILGLHAAAEKAGVRVPVGVWQDALEELLQRSGVDGGFAYHVGGDPTGSMTAAGIASLAIAQKRLDEAARGGRTARRTAEAIARGRAWLAEHWSPRMNPEPRHPEHPKKKWDRWLFYWLYGVERAGTFGNFETIGDHDWYAEGASFLLGRQAKEGHFGGTGYADDEPNTAFGLLFLRRASAPVTGAVATDRWARTFGRDDERAAFSIRAAGGATMRLFVSSWGREGRRFEWRGEERLGPRVARVLYLADGAPIAEAAGDPTLPAGAERFLAEVRFETNGKRTIAARATLVLEGGDERVVESAPVEVEVFDADNPKDRKHADDLRRNLVPGEKPRVEASSQFDDGKWAPIRAVDGHHATGWLSKEDDPEPWIRIEFRRPVTASHLELAHALENPRDPGRFARATEVAVVLDGRRRTSARLDPDDLRKHAIDFGGVHSFRTLLLRVLGRVPGHTHRGAVGFQEIELYRDAKARPVKRGE